VNWNQIELWNLSQYPALIPTIVSVDGLIPKPQFWSPALPCSNSQIMSLYNEIPILCFKPTWLNELCYSSVLNPWKRWIYPARKEWTFSFRMKSGQGRYCVRVSGQQKSHSLFMPLTDSYLERETRPVAQYYWSWSLWCLILVTEKFFFFPPEISYILKVIDLHCQADLIHFYNYSYLKYTYTVNYFCI